MFGLAHRDVKRDLVIEVALESSTSNQREQPPIQFAQPAHDALLGYVLCMMRLMADRDTAPRGGFALELAPAECGQANFARRLFSETPHSDFSKPRTSRRCSAG